MSVIKKSAAISSNLLRLCQSCAKMCANMNVRKKTILENLFEP